ncbi:hypothetical protein EDD86DRAFT_209344 [Gorgonomyces haynaldii]|nr:hypothetical protein EDD86DRAFT_209344 [Gorgonomyces haynaldii]
MKERKRSCITCSKRKTRCDGGKPCQFCFQRKLGCVYAGEEEPEEPKIDTITPGDPLTNEVNQIHFQNWKSVKNVVQPIKKLGVSLETRDRLVTSFAATFVKERLTYLPPETFIQMTKKSPFLFHSTCAMYTLTVGQDQLEGHDRVQLARLFYENAIASLSAAMEKQEIENIIGLVYLFIYCRDSNMGTAAHNFRSMFAGGALDMKLHEMGPSETREQRLKLFLRINVFWMAYITDHFTSVVIGSEPLIHDQIIRVPLPIHRHRFASLELTKHESQDIGIMSSLNGYVPVRPGLSNAATFTLLVKIYSLIRRYTQKRLKHALDDFEMEYQEAVLLGSLKEWKNNSPHFLPDQYFNHDNWYHYYLVIIHQSAIIALYTPKLHLLMNTSMFQLLDSEAFKESHLAATRITEILNLFLQFGIFKSDMVQRYISQGIYNSSVIHDILIRLHSDPVVNAAAHNSFETNLLAAKEMSHCGLPNMIQYQRLEQCKKSRPMDPSMAFDFDFSLYFPQ